MTDWVVAVVMVLALAGLFWMIVTGRPARNGGSGGIASLSAFHDFQARDRQNAVEMIIEQKAGKRLDAQSTGEGKKHESE